MQAQSGVFPPHSAVFTHVAIYAGNGMAYDSTLHTNVSCRSFSDVTAGANIRVRRLAGITPRMQWDICSEASALKGKYNLLRAAIDTFLVNGAKWTQQQHWTQLLHGIANGSVGGAALAESNAPLYCSQLVEAVYSKTLVVTVLNRRVLAPLPAAISEDRQFIEIPIFW